MMCEPEIHMPVAIFVNYVRFMKQWNASLIFKLSVSMIEIIGVVIHIFQQIQSSHTYVNIKDVIVR